MRAHLDGWRIGWTEARMLAGYGVLRSLMCAWRNMWYWPSVVQGGSEE